MGYKYKATMYYSDEDTEQFLREKATKPNGKKSASQYLYSLVTRERENAVSGESEHDDSGVVRMYPPYTYIQWREISGPLSFPSITVLRTNEASQKRFRHKDLMEAIDREIDKDVANVFLRIRPDFYKDGGFLVIIKSEVTCYYSDEITGDSYCRGFYRVNYGTIHVSESEWKKWGGRYDFENIKYIKFRDLFNPSKNKHAGLCQVAERDPLDTSGAFFIPVRKISKVFPSDRLPVPLINGADISFNQNRVKLKAMNATQRKRHFGSSIG
ncbi:hypothetical protein [Serratia liquefaciens]|uniref:hypothetical protein n=1 Tax=Serratia liquefaciens TaxID=614 RepID=UPI00370AD1C2